MEGDIETQSLVAGASAQQLQPAPEEAAHPWPPIRITSCREAGPSGPETFVQTSGKKRKEKREFNMGAYQRRYVALEVFYCGWNYHGFASQADTQETVEGHLFLAMRKTRLIPDNVGWEGLGYSRCGRTDKGVSAIGQVIALWLRSEAKTGEAPLSADEEMDYAVTLNRALPDDIRVLGWTPVPETFSARFSAVHREYKYFIVQRGDLNLAAMREAAGHFVGDHDFRNFCKVDAQHVSSFRRTVLDFRITPLEGLMAGGARVYALHVRGTAFLWHQVRCMAAVLLLVGRGLESPDVVRQLLDVEDTPSKPQYNMAPEEPLLFYACVFDSLCFRRSAQSHAATRAAVQSQLDRHLISTALLHTVSEHLAVQAECEVAGSSQPRPPKHIPLLKRATEPPVEERLTKYGRQIKSRDIAATLATANS
ncbi:g8172 [Coccomyxa elongata]